jgi:hypothetical protein
MLSRLAKYIFPVVITGLAIAAAVLLALLFKKSHTHPTRRPAATLPTRRPAATRRPGKVGLANPYVTNKKAVHRCGAGPMPKAVKPMPRRRQMAGSVLPRPQMGLASPSPYVAAGSAGAAPLR